MVRFVQPESDDDEGSCDDNNADSNNEIAIYSNSYTSNILGFRRGEAVSQLDSRNEYNDVIHYSNPHSPDLGYKRAKIPYLRQFLFVLFILLFGKYIPPPPPPNHSWNDFVAKSTEDVTTALKCFTVLTWYLISGFSFNVYQDANYWTQHILSGEIKNIDHPCKISLPRQQEHEELVGSPSSIVEKYLLETIVGQDEAMRSIAKAFDEWKIPENPSSNNFDQRPLSILLSGSDGVGKKETANLLARLLFQNCTEAEFPVCDDCMEGDSGILELNGVDFAFDEDEDGEGVEGLPNRLTSKILEYVYSRKGAGAVVILNHIEDVPRSTLMDLSHLIKKTNVLFRRRLSQGIARNTNRWITTNTIYSPDSSAEDNVELWLGNILFIFTTEEGAEKVFELVRKYRQPFETLPWHELQTIVKDDVHSNFNGPASDLDVILHRKIKHLSRKYEGKVWKRVELLESAHRQFISPEFAKYIKYGSIVVFASKGGSYLNTLFTIIEKKLDALSFTSRDDIVVVDYHQTQVTVRACDVITEDVTKCFAKSEA